MCAGAHICMLAFILKKMEKLKDISPKYSDIQIASFQYDGEFMDALVELHKQSIALLYHIVYEKYTDSNNEPSEIELDEAILGGNLSRLIKLNTSYLQNVCERKMEICHIIGRSLVETAINIQYLIRNTENNTFRNYIKYSLITEKELLNTIENNVKNRDGKEFNIEKRMKNSILRSFNTSDFQLEEVNKSSKWKSIAARAKDTVNEIFYSVYYGTASHAVLGNWQDLLSHHLTRREKKFKINLDWTTTRPQALDPPIIFNLGIVKDYIKSYSLSDEEEFERITNILTDYYNVIREKHEEHLLKK